jgi:Domain of unknown function (DUF1937)
MIFISAPYTHSNPGVVEARFQAVCRYAAKLFKEGQTAFSPIVMGHMMAKYGHDIPVTSEAWEKYSNDSLLVCKEVHILMLRGWSDSSGVLKEMHAAEMASKPIQLIKWHETWESVK